MFEMLTWKVWVVMHQTDVGAECSECPRLLASCWEWSDDNPESNYGASVDRVRVWVAPYSLWQNLAPE